MLPLFFVPEIGSSPEIEVSGDEARHAIKVVRLEVGEGVQLSDGVSRWIDGRITEVKKNSFVVTVESRHEHDSVVPELIVVQALMKSDRAKEAIELLTVAGVDRIIPWQAERSIAKWQHDLGEKWLTTSQVAAKQSRRPILPAIEDLQSTAVIGKRFAQSAHMIILHEEATTQLSALAHELRSDKHGVIVLVIGPEGGISPQEIELFQSHGGVVTRLGDQVLRSAHAGFASLAAVQALLGRW